MTKVEKFIEWTIDNFFDSNIMHHHKSKIELFKHKFNNLINAAVAEERERNNAWHKQSMLRDLKYLKNCAVGNLFPLYTKEERGECVAKRIDEIVEKLKSNQ